MHLQHFDQIQISLQAYQPDIAGVYCMVSLSRNTFRMAEMIRADLLDCLLVAGGPLPTLYPDHFKGSFDAVFRGEAEESFPRFCRDFLQLEQASRWKLSELSLVGYAGLYIHQDGLIIENPPVHHLEREIDGFALPYQGYFDICAPIFRLYLAFPRSASTDRMTRCNPLFPPQRTRTWLRKSGPA